MTFFLFSSTIHSSLGAGPLYYASLCGFHDLARYLIVKGPEQVNARGGYYVTPLVAALSREDFQMAELLRHHGADPNIQGYERMTPLHSSAFYGDLQMVQELLKYNANISAKDINGRTPLSNALERSTPNGASIVRLLLERGVDVNGHLRWGSTPLHHAVTFGNLEVARVLLEYGANVQAENEEGKTPLQIVSRNGVELRQLLLEHGAK
jgi:ankyrin repeat protein